MTAPLSRRVALQLLAAASLMSVASCKIVAISDQLKIDGQGFDATRYADQIWASKVLPHFAASAEPMGEVLAAIAADLGSAGEKYGYRAATEGSPWTFIVAGSGTITKKNTQSRAGTMTVSVDGMGSGATIQIGPVVKGNAIRDSLPFVSFKDFTNQLQFADVGKALTALALAAIGADAAALTEGQKVSFTGAMSLNRGSDKILITPVSLKAAA